MTTAPIPDSDRDPDALYDGAMVLLAHDHTQSLEDLRRDRSAGVTAKVLQAVIDARVFEPRPEYERSLYSYDGFARWALEAFEGVLELADRFPDELIVVRCRGDLAEAKRSRRLGLILGSEGAKHLEGSLGVLRSFHRLGVRHVQLHWSMRNQLGTSQSDPGEPGLTTFGREVVVEMNRLGMVVDVSHSSPASIVDVLETSTRPIVNSHTGARALNPASGQLLWDEQIRALADRGGVAALHFKSNILAGTTARIATTDDVIRHLRHLIDIGGEDCVALGPDYIPKGPDLDERLRINQRVAEDAWAWTEHLEDSTGLRFLTARLLDAGYRGETVIKILGGNLHRVLAEVLPDDTEERGR